jgi:hypothetical protein
MYLCIINKSQKADTRIYSAKLYSWLFIAQGSKMYGYHSRSERIGYQFETHSVSFSQQCSGNGRFFSAFIRVISGRSFLAEAQRKFAFDMKVFLLIHSLFSMLLFPISYCSSIAAYKTAIQMRIPINYQSKIIIPLSFPWLALIGAEKLFCIHLRSSA